MTCTHRYLDDPTGLVCTRMTPHDPEAPGGHTYESTSCVDAEDPRGGQG